MKRTKLHNQRISEALKGKKKSIEHSRKISESAKRRYATPENNSNYKGENIGYAGIHTWLMKTYGYAKKCEICLKIGEKINNKWNIVWALKRGFLYKRNRQNFVHLCNKCHRNYDKTLSWNRNISKGKLKKAI